jgi:hypothetical protein
MSALCRLDASVGLERECPAAACPFWEPGGAVLEGRCAFELVDFEGRQGLVSELRRVREVLDAVGSDEEERRARHLFHQLLNASGEE